MNTGDARVGGWFKSSRSGAEHNCVEVAFGRDTVAVRDSKVPEAGTALFNRAEWATFIGGVKLGEFDLHRA